MRRLLTGLSLLLLSCSPALGHGVSYGQADTPAIAVYFAYSGNEPMSYAPVLVYGPHSSPDLEHQNGRTDAQGKFAFVPDRAGEWRIIASDGTGHKGAFTLEVTQDMLSAASTPEAPVQAAANPSLTERAILGLSLIGNLCLGALMLRRGRTAAAR